MHRIDIPNAKPADPARQAAAITIRVLRECGMDPYKAARNLMARELCMAWTRGELNEAGFRRAIGNLLITNPNLKGG